MNFVNAYKMGDLFWTAMFLLKLGGEHTLYCRPEHSAHLPGLFIGTGISVLPIHEHPDDCIDLWIGSGANAINWYSEQCPSDVIGFLCKFFEQHGAKMERQDFLWPLPEVNDPAVGSKGHIVIVDAEPQSCQCPQYDPAQMEQLVKSLARKGHFTVCVKGMGWTFDNLATWASHAALIIGVSTGPMWACINQQSKQVPKMILLENIHLDYGPDVPIEHFVNVGQLTEALEKSKWL